VPRRRLGGAAFRCPSETSLARPNVWCADGKTDVKPSHAIYWLSTLACLIAGHWFRSSSDRSHGVFPENALQVSRENAALTVIIVRMYAKCRYVRVLIATVTITIRVTERRIFQTFYFDDASDKTELYRTYDNVYHISSIPTNVVRYVRTIFVFKIADFLHLVYNMVERVPSPLT